MKNLRDARNEIGLTQKKLAQIVGISQQSYSDYENGRTFPDEATLVKIANALNVSTDYLLGRTDELGSVIVPGNGLRLSQDEEEVLSLYAALSPARKTDLMIYLRALSGVTSKSEKKKA